MSATAVNNVTNHDKDSAQHYDYIGHYLKALREHYGLSYQDVTDQLRIRSKYVEALEEGWLEELPGKVYTIGYLQTYAEFLGVDPHAAAEHFEQSHNTAKDSKTFVIGDPPAPAPYPAWLLKAVLAAAVLAVFAVGVYHYARHVGSHVAPVSVEAVPERLLSMPSAGREWVENSSCGVLADAPVWPPCYQGWQKYTADILPHPVAHPLQLPQLVR
jgi:transcriptional regulator with XRE-family HTH domain